MFSLNDVYKALDVEATVKQDYEFSAVSIDSRDIKPDEAFFALKGVRFDGNDFIDTVIKKGVKLIITDKMLDSTNDVIFINQKNTLEALHKLATFVRMKQNYDIVSITGSVGKTLTKDMIAHVMETKYSVTRSKKSFNNDYGVPLTLLSAEKDKSHLVIEIGANHIGEINRLSSIVKPNVGIITNIGSAHIGEFGSVENILKAKTEMMDNVTKGGKLIIFGDDRELKRKVSEKRLLNAVDVITVGFDKENDIFISNIELIEEALIGQINLYKKTYDFKLNFIGEHYLIAFAFAIAVAYIYKINIESAIESFNNFVTPEGRFDIIKSNDKLTIIDDTYNASPEAMINALKSLRYFKNNNIIAILGEMKELGSYNDFFHEKVGEAIDSNYIDFVICYGESAKIISKRAIEGGFNPKKIFYAENINNINEIITENKLINDEVNNVILLKGGRFVHMERARLVLEGRKISCTKRECAKYVYCSKCEEC